MFLSRLRNDIEGSSTVEFAIIAMVLLLLVGGIFDFMSIFWQRNMLIKAVERGARIAAVSNPVAGGASGISSSLVSPGGCTAGAAYPAGAYDCVCTATVGASSTTGSCTGTCGAFSQPAMNTIIYGRGGGSCGLTGRDLYTMGMCDVISNLVGATVIVEYSDTQLGYCGRPAGPVPTITVTVQNIQFSYVFLGGLMSLANPSLTTAKATITGEDLSTLSQ